jgi:hypothetical protein
VGFLYLDGGKWPHLPFCEIGVVGLRGTSSLCKSKPGTSEDQLIVQTGQTIQLTTKHKIVLGVVSHIGCFGLINLPIIISKSYQAYPIEGFHTHINESFPISVAARFSSSQVRPLLISICPSQVLCWDLLSASPRSPCLLLSFLPLVIGPSHLILVTDIARPSQWILQDSSRRGRTGRTPRRSR